MVGNPIIATLQRPLITDEIDFRVSELRENKGGVWASILVYKNARCDMKRLDEATGGVWQNKYVRDTQGVLQCGIGIKIGEEWVWKWSNGTPSNFEREKGEYSDAFKRAGFMWGIGRELYDYPTMSAKLNETEYNKSQGKIKASWYLKPQTWEWQVKSVNNKIHVRALENGKQRL